MAKDKVCALILAAGKSSRMGQPKFLLDFDNNKCFLENILGAYTALGISKTVIVLNKEGKLLFDEKKMGLSDNQEITINNHPEWERFYSIKTGLEQLKNADWVFIHPVDNPYIETEVAKALIKNKNKADYIVPRYLEKGGHPILIGKKVINQLLNTNENDLNFKYFLQSFSRFDIEVDTEKVLLNINTLRDYDRFMER